MELAPSECRKSLDQLLEQAIAERSREDDQVEVTYEMIGDCSSDQRPVRLMKDESASSSNRLDKEEVEEENENDVGSIQMERKVMRSTVILSIAMLLCFSGFSVVQSLLSTSVPGTGVQSLGILYMFATLSVLFAPIITRNLGSKWTMVFSALMPIIFVISFHYSYTSVLILSSIISGITFGPSYRAQKSYLFRNISRLSFLTQAIRSKVQQRFLRSFFIISKSFYFWGHLMATIIMEISYTPVSKQNPNNTSNETTFSVIRRIETCSRTQCGNSFLSKESSFLKVENLSQITSSISIPSNVTELFMYVFTVVSLVGILLIILFLEKLEVLLEQDPLERPLFYQTLRQIKLLIVDSNVCLVVLMVIFIGIEQAFIFGDFTRDYISCALGLESIGFTMMCLGGCHTLGSIGVHVFSQHFQRPIIMAAALVCQTGLLMVLWLWTPVKDDAAVFYVISGGWGLCNAVWETLVLSFLTTTYPDDWQTPICVYYLLQWTGMSLTYSFSNFICPHIKILILAVILAISIIPFTILEFRLHQRSHVQNRTSMI